MLCVFVCGCRCVCVCDGNFELVGGGAIPKSRELFLSNYFFEAYQGGVATCWGLVETWTFWERAPNLIFFFFFSSFFYLLLALSSFAFSSSHLTKQVLGRTVAPTISDKSTKYTKVFPLINNGRLEWNIFIMVPQHRSQVIENGNGINSAILVSKKSTQVHMSLVRGGR